MKTAEHPKSVLNWLRNKTSGASLLQQLLTSGYPLSHELLDTFPHSQAATHLRQLLVHVGVLPARDENMARTEQWMRRCMDQAGEHREILQPYATWVVLRRLRRRAQDRGVTFKGAQYARSRVTIALEFLRWLGSRGLSLQSAGQADLDLWLAEGNTSRLGLRDFVRWTNRCRLATGLDVPWRPESEPVNFFDEDEYLALLTRCVNDPELPLDVRTAGALTLLYGVTVTRIAHLTSQDIERRQDGTYISIGHHPVLMPPALDRLVTAQTQATAPSIVGQATPGPEPWLFPGRLAGKPIRPERLSKRLAAHGIDTRAARNTAVLTLASDLPAPILSKVLGVHINTAVDWVRYASRDWAHYLAARADDLKQGNTAAPE
ncbi:hypothetical protein [Actinomadura sp. 6N118]|uniref:hypothetical protein n=1 Tax=Actinomadura sp. 6N118 TaxID=3375151 RepID=UPI00378FA4CD